MASSAILKRWALFLCVLAWQAIRLAQGECEVFYDLAICVHSFGVVLAVPDRMVRRVRFGALMRYPTLEKIQAFFPMVEVSNCLTPCFLGKAFGLCTLQ